MALILARDIPRIVPTILVRREPSDACIHKIAQPGETPPAGEVVAVKAGGLRLAHQVADIEVSIENKMGDRSIHAIVIPLPGRPLDAATGLAIDEEAPEGRAVENIALEAQEAVIACGDAAPVDRPSLHIEKSESQPHQRPLTSHTSPR